MNYLKTKTLERKLNLNENLVHVFNVKLFFDVRVSKNFIVGRQNCATVNLLLNLYVVYLLKSTADTIFSLHCFLAESRLQIQPRNVKLLSSLFENLEAK